MKFKILRPSHSHIQGEVSFWLVKQDPYDHYKPIGKQFFRELTPEYHLDYFGKFPEFHKEPQHYAERFIIKELQQKFKEMLLQVDKQITENTILIFNDNKYEKQDLDFFTIE